MNHILTMSLLLAALCLPAASANEPQHNEPSAGQEQATQTEPNSLDVDPRLSAHDFLSGRGIVVRVHNNWPTEPAKYKLVEVELDGLSVCFDAVEEALGKIAKTAIVVVVVEDQKDPAVAMVIGDCVHARYYKKGGCFSIWPWDYAGKRSAYWSFSDALGQAIAKAEVQILVSPTSSSKDPRLALNSTRTDEQGRVKTAIVRSDLQWFYFVVSHPDYGKALVKQPLNVTDFSAPLVKTGSEAEQRAARGIIVDSENSPIKGATIQCYSIGTPGGGTLLRSRTSSVHDRVITDNSGYFRLYLPIDNKLERMGGELIPTASRYDVQIRPPKELKVSPARQRISNHTEVTITLRPPQEGTEGKYFHTFTFEDANGPITEPERLKRIEVRIWSKGSRVLKYKDWKDGGLFDLGMYEAKEKVYCFERLNVSKDSPEELVFSIVPARYAGQVIDGATGEPLAGAFVLADCYEITRELSSVTPEQWKAIHALESSPDVYDAALRPLRRACRFYQVTRTDKNGFYGLTVTPGPSSYEICVVEENYLAREISFWPAKKRDPENALVRIFPAAKVLLEPIKEDPVVVQPYWIIDANDNPDWVSDFVKTYGGRKIEISSIIPNHPRTIFVPAGLNFRLQLCTSGKWCPITIPQSINLTQGELLDIGRQVFQPGIPVIVKVVDSERNGVEGVMVTQLFDGLLHPWSHTRNPITNKNGLVTFNAPPYSKGRFCIRIRTDGRRGLEEQPTISYQIGGEEDAGREFTIQLSDEMLQELLK